VIEREKRVKLKIDVEKDLAGVKGYQITKVGEKNYRKGGLISQFKVDGMTSLGPSLVGAFGSTDSIQTSQLHSFLKEMIKSSSSSRTKGAAAGKANKCKKIRNFIKRSKRVYCPTDASNLISFKTTRSSFVTTNGKKHCVVSS